MHSAISAIIAFITLAAAWAWLVAHQLALGWIIAAMIERLPPPGTANAPSVGTTTGKFYAYAYSVLQFFAANTMRTQDAVATARTPKAP